jgi:hypothetical protein
MNPLRWRKMTWVVLIWTGLMFAWMIGGAASAQDSADCASEATQALRDACEAGTDIGTGLGVAALFFLWFIGFLVLSIVWFMTRRKGRECPVCGEDVKKGRTTCKKCGHDFAASVRPGSPAVVGS